MGEENFRRLYNEAMDVISDLYTELRKKDEEVERIKKEKDDEIKKLKEELENLKTPKSPTKTRLKEIERTPGQMEPIICGLEFPSNRVIFKIKWDENEEKPLDYRMETVIKTFEPEIKGYLNKLKKEKSVKINTIRKKNLKQLLKLLD